ncbi:hypothetical protein ACE6H2_026284 [Prunus campanulata]
MSSPVPSSLIRNGVLIESLINPLLRIIYTHPTFLLSCIWCLFLSIFYYYISSPNPVFLLDFSCFKPNPNQKCSYKASEHFVFRTNRFSEESQEFMRKIYLKSGLGDETYAPKFVFQPNPKADLKSAMDEAQEGMFSSINSLLSKTNIDPSLIDCLIVTCGSFSPMPSLTALIVNHFKLKSDVKTYNLSGMGCSSGVMSIDLAANVLKQSQKIGYALVVIIETITLNWYYELPRWNSFTRFETHHGANDRAYKAAFQEEDDKGCTGFSLTKDLIPVAGMFLREHIKILGPRVLPLSQLGLYVYSVIRSTMTRGASKPIVPDFTKAFDHFCIHTGGKAVIEQVGRVLRLGEEFTEPARMILHRFGNTSSSLVFYELAYLEAKGRVKKGDRVWMLGFGTGFKVGSLVWKALLDLGNERDNPWSDCIDRYPLKSW